MNLVIYREANFTFELNAGIFNVEAVLDFAALLNE